MIKTDVLFVLIFWLTTLAPVLAAPPRVLELRASELTVQENGRIIEARGNVRITDGRNRVQAERALYAVGDRRIQLTGSVSVTGDAGTLNSQRAVIRLTRDRRIDTVEASGNVTLRTRGRVLRASRVSYIVGGGTISASGDVSLSIPPGIVARGHQLTVRENTGGKGATATLNGGARVQTRGGSIQADRLEFVESEQVAHARGNVTALFQDTRITSSAATFYGHEQKAVFREGVTVMRPGRIMKADVVTVFYDDRRIVAEGETNIIFDEERREP